LRVYISGPISEGGTLSLATVMVNLAVFNQAAGLLRDAGYEVVNPASLNHENLHPYAPDPHTGDLAHWQECMRSDLKEMLDCQAIVLLPLWERSPGSVRELLIAIWLGFDVMRLTEAGTVEPMATEGLHPEELL
jgi:hypothetical protein